MRRNEGEVPFEVVGVPAPLGLHHGHMIQALTWLDCNLGTLKWIHRLFEMTVMDDLLHITMSICSRFLIRPFFYEGTHERMHSVNNKSAARWREFVFVIHH